MVLPAVVGIASAAVIVLVLALIKAFKKGGQKSAAVWAVIIIGVSAAVSGILFGTGTAKFEDEKVIFTDSYVMRSITGYGREDTEKNIYTDLRDDGFYVALQNPILGVGPDNAVYYLSLYGTSTDRFYNEYADIAATRGIPCLIVYGIFILASIVKMFGAVKKFIGGQASWIAPAASAAALAYLVQAFFNTSWVNSTLYLYIMLGLVWSFGAIREKKSE
jgi:O-antigen ligase